MSERDDLIARLRRNGIVLVGHGKDGVLEDGQVRFAWHGGPGRRPDDPQWALDMYAACRDSGTSFFYKQSGARYSGVVEPGRDVPSKGQSLIRQFPLPLKMRVGA